MSDTSSTLSSTAQDNGLAAAENAFAALLTGEPENQEESEALANGAEEVSDAEEYDDAEDAPEDSDQGDDEDADEGDEEQPTYTIKVDGEEVQVTLQELLSGYSRTQDYTRKTQKLAEERRAAQAEFEQVRGERTQYANLLEALRSQVEGNQPAEPDWDRLRAEDPIEYGVQWAEHQRRQQRVAAIRAEQARVAEIQRAEQIQYLQGQLESEKQALLEVLPTWKDGEKAKAERADILRWAKDAGYTDTELNSVVRSKDVLTLRKAMLYDRMMQRKDQVKPVVKPGKPVLRPGSAETAPRRASELTRAKQRLAKTGRTADAADAFFALLTSEK